MIRFLSERIVYALAVILAVISVAFALLHLSGDPLAGLVPPGASPEQEAVMRNHFGLDRSLPVQYLTYLGNVSHGDFGDSWRARQPALDVVLARLSATLALTGAALALAILIGVPLGILAGSRRGGALDLLAMSGSSLGQAIPAFWLGTLLILIFAVHLHWLPSSGGDGLRSLVLPAISLALYPAASIARLLRSSLADTLGDDYIRTARGKGLTERQVVRHHALRNAGLPALAFIGIQIGFLLGGAVVVEGVFAFPGIGQLALNAVADRDLPVIQAVLVTVATGIVIANLLVELAARLLDPRLAERPGTSGAWS